MFITVNLKNGREAVVVKEDVSALFQTATRDSAILRVKTGFNFDTDRSASAYPSAYPYDSYDINDAEYERLKALLLAEAN